MPPDSYDLAQAVAAIDAAVRAAGHAPARLEWSGDSRAAWIGSGALYLSAEGTMHFRATGAQRGRRCTVDWRDPAAIARAMPEIVEAIVWWGERLRHELLRPGARYRVLRTFLEASAGEIVTCIEARFIPHDGAHQWLFRRESGELLALVEHADACRPIVVDLDLYLEEE